MKFIFSIICTYNELSINLKDARDASWISVKIELVEMKQILNNSLSMLCVIYMLKITFLNISSVIIRDLFCFTVISHND